MKHMKREPLYFIAHNRYNRLKKKTDQAPIKIVKSSSALNWKWLTLQNTAVEWSAKQF